jgi:hypothetical protein
MMHFATPRTSKHFLTALAGLSCVVLALPVVAFEPPHWAGETGTEHSEWDAFTTAFGEPGNSPDVVGSTGDANLRQLTPGATLTGTLNIYNPAGASTFAITDDFAQPAETIVFQATVSGTQLDTDSVKLEFEQGDSRVSLGAVREELQRVSGGFGDTVTSRWSWNLRGRDASSMTVKFTALGAHCSLTAARLDVRYKPEATPLTQAEPAHDRWGYPFNATPGTRAVASVFRSAAAEGLVRHGIFIFGYDTSTGIESGRGEAAYEILSAKVTLMTSSNFEVVYDPTADPVFTYLTNGHPQFVEDADAGRPIELFGAGFRNDFTPLTWTETAPYAPTGGERNVYPVTWDADGQELDASMNVNYAAPYEALPFATGVIAGANPGDNVPLETPVSFDLDLSQPGVTRYLQAGLNVGRLFFTATSLHSGGQGVRTFPEYYTRDSLLGEAPSLELSVRLYESQEVITVSSIITSSGTRTLRFPSSEAASYGIRWSTDLKNWHLVREPELTAPEAGVSKWVDGSEAGARKFYQVYLQP